MKKNELVLAYITTKDKDEARKLGRTLVEEKFAACVNIIDGMESHYWWEGKLESSKEAILIAKTEKARSQILLKRVKELHTYTCPCVLFLPVLGGNPDYLKWLSENL
jgi:periplasmic divalent cation tolerance protein